MISFEEKRTLCQLSIDDLDEALTDSKYSYQLYCALQSTLSTKQNFLLLRKLGENPHFAYNVAVSYQNRLSTRQLEFLEICVYPDPRYACLYALDIHRYMDPIINEYITGDHKKFYDEVKDFAARLKKRTYLSGDIKFAVKKSDWAFIYAFDNQNILSDEDLKLAQTSACESGYYAMNFMHQIKRADKQYCLDHMNDFFKNQYNKLVMSIACE